MSLDRKDLKMTLVGDIDVIDMVKKLRKLGHAEILSVGPGNEVKKKVLKQHEEEKNKEKIEDKKYRNPAMSLSNHIKRVMWNNLGLGFRVLDIFRLFKIKIY